MVLDSILVQSLIEQYGLIGVFIVTFVANTIIPLPAWPARSWT